MSLQQLRKEVNEIKENVKSRAHRNMLADIPLTPELDRCCHEFIRAQSEARQRLIYSGISESELKKHEHDNFIGDTLVMEAVHNRLRALCNAKNPDKELIKIKYLFDIEL